MNTFLRLFLISLLLCAAGNLRAQSPAETPVEPTVTDPDEIIGTLILSDESALQVIDLLEQLTDKIILRRQDISPAKINFNSRGSISKQEAVLALESLLTLNGIMLTDMGGRFMKAVPATDVNRHVPEMLYGSTLDMAPSQQIYAKLFRFDYLNAEQASGTLISPLLSQNSSFIPFPKSNALLITDALINLQRIETILAEADQPEALREKIKFIKLSFIQAAEAQSQLEQLIQGPLKSYLEGNTSVSSDERTNQLIIVTHPGNLEIIMNVIENIDVDAAPLTSSEVFQLRQAKAEEVVPIIENIIQGQREGREKDAETAANNRNQQAGLPNNPLAAAAAAAQAAAANAGSSEANSSLQFSSFVGLSADERTNAIVAYGTQQDLKTLKDLIEKIDIPLPQVRIEAIITEVSLGESQASGLSSFSALFYDGEGTSIGSGDDTLEIFPFGRDTAGPFSLGTGSLSGAGAFGNFAVEAVMDISESDSDIKILSTPTIVVSHNEEGVINVSESRPFITSTTTNNLDTITNDLTRSSVEYRDVGIQLTVTPLIGIDGSVTMTIEQTVDTIRDASVATRPIIGKREANSTITVRDSEVIILGGLQENTRDITTTYFPFVGRWPIVGDIFSGESIEYVRTELIIFIRPTILRTPEEARTMSEEKIGAIKGGEAVQEYLEEGSTGEIYMEGSELKENTIMERVKNNFRSLRDY
jgi:general secretion pathway protein D